MSRSLHANLLVADVVAGDGRRVRAGGAGHESRLGDRGDLGPVHAIDTVAENCGAEPALPLGTALLLSGAGEALPEVQRAGQSASDMDSEADASAGEQLRAVLVDPNRDGLLCARRSG